MKVKLQNEIMISLLFGVWNYNFVMLYGGDENCTNRIMFLLTIEGEKKYN